jgi:hypothetical protein
MAAATLNPAFTSFKGSLGHIVFYSRWGNTYARKYVKPRNPDSEGQKKSRCLFREAMKSWQALTVEDKQRYIFKARNLPMTGHNFFVSEYMKKHREEGRVQECGAESIRHQSLSGLPFIHPAIHNVTAPSLPVDCFYSPSGRVLRQTG